MVPAGEVIALPVTPSTLPDLGALGIHQRDVQELAAYVDSTEELVRLTFADVSRFRGLGRPGAMRIAKALERAGLAFASVAADEQPAKAIKPFDWNDVNTWPATFNGADVTTWPREAIEQDVPAGVSWRKMAWKQHELRRARANG